MYYRLQITVIKKRLSIIKIMDQVEINKQAKLSEHMTLGELTKTKHVTADQNIPSHEVIENLKRLCWLHFAVRPPAQQNRRRISFIKVG